MTPYFYFRACGNNSDACCCRPAACKFCMFYRSAETAANLQDDGTWEGGTISLCRVCFLSVPQEAITGKLALFIGRESRYERRQDCCASLRLKYCLSAIPRRCFFFFPKFVAFPRPRRSSMLSSSAADAHEVLRGQLAVWRMMATRGPERSGELCRARERIPKLAVKKKVLCRKMSWTLEFL